MSGQRLSAWLLPLFVALSLSTPLAPQPRCSSGKELALSLSYSTNATGHRAVSANLEQPMGSPGWLLDMQVRTSGCAPDGIPWRSLTISLNGPPEEGFLAPSPAPSTPTAPTTPRPAPPGYLTLPGLGHYRAPPEAKDWAAARELCRGEGGGLLTPTSQHEVDLLFKHFSPNATGAYNTDAFWTSANDIEQEGKFVTEDGVPLEDTGFAVFYPGRPTSSTSSNCILILKQKSLHDYDCTKKYPYICKVPL